MSPLKVTTSQPASNTSRQILRSPRQIAGEGCSHSVKIAQRRLSEALALLYRADLMPKRVFSKDVGGDYKEVEL